MNKVTLMAVFLSASAAYAILPSDIETGIKLATGRVAATTDGLNTSLMNGMDTLSGAHYSTVSGQGAGSFYAFYNQGSSLTFATAAFTNNSGTLTLTDGSNVYTTPAPSGAIASGASFVLSKSDGAAFAFVTSTTYTGVAGLLTALNTYFQTGATVTGIGTIDGGLTTAQTNIHSSSTVLAGITNVANQLDGTTGELYGKVTTVKANVHASTSDLATAVSNVSTKLGSTGDLYTKANAALTSLGTGFGSDVNTAAGAAKGAIKPSGSSVYDAVASVSGKIGGVESDLYANATSALTNLGSGTGYGDVNAGVSTAMAKIDSGASTVKDAIQAASDKLAYGAGDIPTAISNLLALLG